MTSSIVLFLAFGAFCGIATWSNRHLFSEGPTRPAAKVSRDLLDGRRMWMLICCGLWPLMVLTGLHSLRRVSRERATATARHDRNG